MIIYNHTDPRDLSAEDLLDTLLWVHDLQKEKDVAPRHRRLIALRIELLRRLKKGENDARED